MSMPAALEQDEPQRPERALKLPQRRIAVQEDARASRDCYVIAEAVRTPARPNPLRAIPNEVMARAKLTAGPRIPTLV